MKTVILLLVLFANSAHASEWEIASLIGTNYGGKNAENYTFTDPLGVGTPVSGKGESKQKGIGAEFGFEVTRYFNNVVGSSFIVGYSTFKNAGGSTDKIITFMASPRLQFGESVKYWFGLGIGFTITTMQNTAASDDTMTLRLDSSSHNYFIVSPRIGVDFPIGENYFIGVQESYISGTTTITGSGKVGSSDFVLSDDVTRDYFSTIIRVGYKFGSESKKESHLSP